MDIKESWWTRTSCGINVINDVAAHIFDDEDVIIFSSVELPWTDCFHTKLKEHYHSSDRTFSFINGNGVENPGRYLFDKYCPSDLQADYWPAPGYSFANFLAEQDQIRLNHRIIVVSDIRSGNELDRWSSFVDAYKKESKLQDKTLERAVFILEYCGDRKRLQSDHFASVFFAPTEIDIYTYNIINTREYNLSSMLNKYLAELITSLSEFNIEQNGLLSEHGLNIMYSPRATYRAVEANNETMEDRTDAVIEAKIFHAQLKALFPAVEQRRCEIINKYIAGIRKILPWTNDYGETRTDPFDMELRDLLFKYDEIGMSYDDKEFVKVLRDLRNDLAHNHTLKYDRILTLCEE